MSQLRYDTDVLVIGSGIAGLSFALSIAEERNVTVVTKRSRQDSASRWAQGGIAAVLDEGDSFDAHIKDTLATGGGLSDPDVVRMVVESGPERIHELIRLGTKFSKGESGQDLDLTMEGGHSARRVVHAGDITGEEVQRALIAAVEDHNNIEVLEGHMAVDLIETSRFGGPKRVAGAYIIDEDSREVKTFVARATVLASGGAGKVYLYTSNPDVATGDGVAMAYRAGATIANMEFFQFHPTCLFHPAAKSFLISEALRGEGGVLRLANGEAFMKLHHEMKDLAPRDVVARAIDFEMKRSGQPHVFLDMTHEKAIFLRDRFPNIHARCQSLGIDMTSEPIPVVPAAHYMCGGIRVDIDGKTSLPGLWAIGEVTCSGLHGANRLASNSLLEGLVFGHRVAQTIEFQEKTVAQSAIRDWAIPNWNCGSAVASDEEVVVSQNWEELRRFMWNYVGIVRTEKRLRRAAKRISVLQEEIREYYWEHLVSRDMLELRNIADVAEMIIISASFRKESRGLHFTLDHQDSDDRAFGGNTCLQHGGFPYIN